MCKRANKKPILDIKIFNLFAAITMPCITDLNAYMYIIIFIEVLDEYLTLMKQQDFYGTKRSTLL